MSGRIRTIKPEWLEDELLVMASSDARVLSVALLLLADDYGNGRLVPQVLSSRIFPRLPGIFANALAELENIRFVVRYEVDGQKYFSIRNWNKHQKVDKPGKPRVPAMLAGVPEKIRESLAKVPESLATDPDLDPDLDQEGKGARERPPTPRLGDSLAEHIISTQEAEALVAHYQQARLTRGFAQTLVTPPMWRTQAKTILALAKHDLDVAKRVVDAFVSADHDWWAKANWPLSMLAQDRDFERALLLVDAQDLPKSKTARSKMAAYHARLARETAEIDAMNAAEDAAKAGA